MISFKQILRILLTCAAVTAVTACGGATTALPAPTARPLATSTPPEATGASTAEETILRVGLPFLSRSPASPRGGFGAIRWGVGETLFRLSADDLKPEPWLATGATQIDEKTWEITLREGVKFHNGASMDAAAVKASLERAIGESGAAKALLDIARIDVKDPLTVTIVTNAPSPIMPGLLTGTTTTIVDAAAAETMGDAFTERPVLTGPFKVEKFQQEKEMVVVRHDQYWGPSPSAHRVKFIYLPDGNSRVLALQSGDIDIADYIAPESVTVVKNSPKLVVRAAAPVSLEFMYLNHRREPWKDARVRQAIALSIDREGLVKAVMQGRGIVAAGPFPPAVLACPQLRKHTLDPAKAKQLMAQAGYRDEDGDGYLEKDGQPLAMTLLTYPQRPELTPMAETIQASLKTLGIKVNIRVTEGIDAALEQGDWDGGMYFNNMTVTGDPYRALLQFFSTGGSANFGGYSSPRVDELTRQVGQAAARPEREQLACAASQAIIDEVAVVPLLYPNFNYGVSSKVVGFDEPHPFWLYFVDSGTGKR